MTPPTAEGGALRSQDIRTTGDPTGLDGAILRVNPDTGAAMAGNPNIGSADLNTRRIVAHGLRNPFRITVRPGTNEVWAGDVGWNTWEEINRVQSPTGGTTNFGWPCYEGAAAHERLRQPEPQRLREPLQRRKLRLDAAVLHVQPLGQGRDGRDLPDRRLVDLRPRVLHGRQLRARVQRALFFSDYSRATASGSCSPARTGCPTPPPGRRSSRPRQARSSCRSGPDGDLYYVDMPGGTIRRVRGPSTNRTPTAVATATPTSGPAPLDGRLRRPRLQRPRRRHAGLRLGPRRRTGRTTTRPPPTPSRTYIVARDGHGRPARDRHRRADRHRHRRRSRPARPPTATITSPRRRHAPGGSATRSRSRARARTPRARRSRRARSPGRSTSSTATARARAATRTSLQSLTGAGGSIVAPDHEYPSHLELQLTARDASGLTRTVTRRLDPRTVALTLAVQPGGRRPDASARRWRPRRSRATSSSARPTPSRRPRRSTLGGVPYAFASWSDGGAAPPRDRRRTRRRPTPRPTRRRDPSGSPARTSWARTRARRLPAGAEVYRTIAAVDGLATRLRVRLAPHVGGLRGGARPLRRHRRPARPRCSRAGG